MDVTEAILKERAVAPRVTLEDVNGYISSEHYFTAEEGVIGETFMRGERAGHQPVSLRLLTVCVMVLRNGYTVLGKSACADPDNYAKDIGRELARKDAIGQIWPLLGFELRSKLAIVERAGPLGGALLDHYPAETYLGTKVVYAAPMTRQAYNDLRGWQLPSDEDGTDEGYLVQYADGGKTNLEGFNGYVSWSPKDVFEDAYILMLKKDAKKVTIQ